MHPFARRRAPARRRRRPGRGEFSMDKAKRPSSADYERLAAFRFTLRRFLSQADFNARNAGLTAQQYQALLSIRGGYPGRDEISIGDLAANLLLKNHSA